MPQIAIQVEEVQKLNQFQLQTGVETVIAFPLDVMKLHGKRLDPAGLSPTELLISFKVKNLEENKKKKNSTSSGHTFVTMRLTYRCVDA